MIINIQEVTPILSEKKQTKPNYFPCFLPLFQLQPQPSQLVCRDSMNSPVKCKKTGSQAFIVAGPTTAVRASDTTGLLI